MTLDLAQSTWFLRYGHIKLQFRQGKVSISDVGSHSQIVCFKEFTRQKVGAGVRG